MCVCVTVWVRDDPHDSNLWSSVLKRQRSTLELVFYLNPQHSHKQKYFFHIHRKEQWKGQNSESCPWMWMAEGSTVGKEGGDRRSRKSVGFMTPWEKGEIRQKSLGSRSLLSPAGALEETEGRAHRDWQGKKKLGGEVEAHYHVSGWDTNRVR